MRRLGMALLIILSFLFIVAVAAVLLARHFGLSPYALFGNAMEPTIHTGDRVVLQLGSYPAYTPARGDIVVFKYPNDLSLNYMERVIGLPGEHVQVRDGHVSINGHQLSEPYLGSLPNYTVDTTVAAGYLYVLGDNRSASSDSHEWGALPLYNITGHVLAIYWPRQSLIQHPSYPGLQ